MRQGHAPRPVLKLLVQGCSNKEIAASPWLVSATKVYSGLGANIVIESITTLGIRDFTKRRLSNFLQKLSRWCVTRLTNVL